jgi:hypothetical protein
MKFQKYIFYTLMILSMFMSSCDHESEGVSKITYYPTFTLHGEPSVLVKLGTPYTDEGATSTEAGTTIENKTTYTGTYFNGPVSTIDTNVPDVYTVSYTAINKDGFPGVTNRTVYVAGQGDLVNNLEGLYTATVVRNGVVSAQYEDLEYVIISKTGADTYALSDGIAGYYDFGRSLGAGYSAPGATFKANDIASNDFTFGPTFTVNTFGGEADITEMDVDAASKTIHYVATWDAGPYTFDITLKQVQF